MTRSVGGVRATVPRAWLQITPQKWVRFHAKTRIVVSQMKKTGEEAGSVQGQETTVLCEG
jgi:hypothetical protein